MTLACHELPGRIGCVEGHHQGLAILADRANLAAAWPAVFGVVGAASGTGVAVTSGTRWYK